MSLNENSHAHGHFKKGDTLAIEANMPLTLQLRDSLSNFCTTLG